MSIVRVASWEWRQTKKRSGLFKVTTGKEKEGGLKLLTLPLFQKKITSLAILSSHLAPLLRLPFFGSPS